MEYLKWFFKFIISNVGSFFLAITKYLPLANHQLKRGTQKIVKRNVDPRTFYTFRFLIIGTLFFISPFAIAQKLILENNIAEREYKLGYLRHVRISSILDSTHSFGAYVSKTKNDTLYFIGGKKIALADINSIRFTPRNLFTRVGKPILYSTGVFISGFVALVFSPTEKTYSIGQRSLFFIGGTLYSTVLIEAAGTGFWIITPKRELRKGINLTILNK